MHSQIGKAPSKAVLAQGFSSQGILPLPPSPQTPRPTLCRKRHPPTRHRTSFKEEGRFCGSRSPGDPWEPSPSTHMQSSKHLLLRPRLWGVQKCSRRSQHVPADTARTRGQPSCTDPPRRPRHSPTGRKIHHLCGRACPSGAGHLACKAPSRNHRWMSRPRPLRAGGGDPSCPRRVTD